MSYYKAGAITVTNGSKTVTSDGETAFVSQVMQGDTLIVGGVSAVIDVITDSSTLQLVNPWAGPTTANTTEYVINRTGAGWHSTVTFNERMTNLLDTLTQQVANAGSGGGSAVTLAALSLSNSSVQENSTAGVVVGTVQGKSSGSTLSLVDNAGGRFVLNGLNQIVTGSTPTDFETATHHQITVRETLSGASNTPRDTTFDILVLDVYEGPTVTLANLSLSPASITSGSAAGTVVGSLSGQTSGSTVTLIDNAGGRFSLNGSGGSYQVVCGTTATNYSSATSHTITVRESFSGATNSPHDTVITITVAQAQTAPTLSALALSANTITSGATQGTVVGTLSGKTSGSTLSLSDTAGGRFALSGTTIVAGATATNYSSAQSHSITVTETLAGASNSPRQTTFTINVQSSGTTVTLGALSLPTRSVTENTAPGTVITAIQGMTAGSTLSLTDDAGGRVAISGTNLVTGSTNIDYEITPTISITIRETLTGATNTPRDNTFTINVTDVSESTNILYGYPDANSAGVRSGHTLTTYTGPMVITTANTTISDKIINGKITIQANGCTISDCKITGGGDVAVLIPDPYTATIQYCDILGAPTTNGIAGAGTFTGNDISNCENGINLYGVCTIKDNYIHDFHNSGSPHYDGLEMNGGNYTGTLIQHNTIINQQTWTSAIMVGNSGQFGPSYGVTIDNNYLAGGGYTIYCEDKRNTITNNYLGQGYYGYVYDDGGTTFPNTYTGNHELGTNWPAPNSGSGTGGGGGGTTTTLGVLSLSSTSVAGGASNGTVVGAITGKTAGSTLSLSNNGGGRFTISGTNLITTSTPTTAGGSYTVVIVETLVGASNSPRSTSFTITATGTGVTLWNGDTGGSLDADPVADGYNLGTVITFNVAGSITGIRFRRSAEMAATGSVGIYDTFSNGNALLYSQNYTGMTGTGWVEVVLTTPYAVTAGQQIQIQWFDASPDGANTYYWNINGVLPITSAGGEMTADQGVYREEDQLAPATNGVTFAYYVDCTFVPA